jgi:histidinol-phosphatase
VSGYDLDVGTNWDSDLELALDLANFADRLSLPRFGALDLQVETKPDLTPVSEADRAVEAMVRDRLAKDRPGDAIVGEEFGITGSGDRRWIIDPIDGTKSYVRGIPAWALLLALEVDGEIVVGVASAPALERRWWASAAGGSFANGKEIKVSQVDDLKDAHLSMVNVRDWAAIGREKQALELERRVWRPVGLGDFWGHTLVAQGTLDVMIEPELRYWDIAALRPIVEQAGGRCTDLAGNPAKGPGGAITTNGLLHDIVLEVLN